MSTTRLAKRVMDLFLDDALTIECRSALFDIALEIEQMQTAHDFMAKDQERMRKRAVSPQDDGKGLTRPFGHAVDL